MLNYDTLIGDVCNQFSKVKELYNEELKKDSLDMDSGAHTFFSFCFVPILKSGIINSDNKLIKEMFDYIEKMENSEDDNVGEVADFTILEELLDEFGLSKIEQYMGVNTKKIAKLINRYISID